MSRRKQTEQRELWRQRVAQQMSSGQGVRAFCREHELGEHSFYQWRKRIDSGASLRLAFSALSQTEFRPPPDRYSGARKPQAPAAEPSGASDDDEPATRRSAA